MVQNWIIADIALTHYTNHLYVLVNYFEFYQLPVSFYLDDSELKRRFYAMNRQYHPDFFTQADAQLQEEALEMTSLNNKAYQTLADKDLRTKHILQINELFQEDEKYQLPPSFLMEMMDINEELMDIQFSDNPKDGLARLSHQIDNMENSLQKDIHPVMQAFDKNPQNTEGLALVKEFYYKNRYLLRVKESLSNFATS